MSWSAPIDRLSSATSCRMYCPQWNQGRVSSRWNPPRIGTPNRQSRLIIPWGIASGNSLSVIPKETRRPLVANSASANAGVSWKKSSRSQYLLNTYFYIFSPLTCSHRFKFFICNLIHFQEGVPIRRFFIFRFGQRIFQFPFFSCRTAISRILGNGSKHIFFIAIKLSTNIDHILKY